MGGPHLFVTQIVVFLVIRNRAWIFGSKYPMNEFTSICQSSVEENLLDDLQIKMVILIFRNNEIDFYMTLYLRISKQHCVNQCRVNSVNFFITWFLQQNGCNTNGNDFA